MQVKGNEYGKKQIMLAQMWGASKSHSELRLQTGTATHHTWQCLPVQNM
jgi:hypothetical protein